MNENNGEQEQNDATAPMPKVEDDRQAQPVDAEQPPRLAFAVVGIGASAGGLEAVTEFLGELRADSGMAYVFVQHLPPTGETMLVEILSKRTDLKVLHVEEGMAIEPNHFYVIRPGYTLAIIEGKFRLGERLSRPMGNRPVDDFFKSLAEEQRERAIAIIMSGMGSNGTAGAQAIKAVGGLCIAQDPESTQYPSMPRHLIDAGYADYILRPRDMPDVLLSYAGHPYAMGQREAGEELAERDRQHLREILAILRTRTRQDFSGYKKPTVLRRIQRRMGLTHVTQLGEYARLLRQSTTEVTSLSDDLLIHVTGFFRDPAAWEVLRERVVVPLVASREANGIIRCWVTACSSGEEAYSLAILLCEEAERVNKPLDIKVFATDLADRSLQNARSGLYPGGIEAEILPERLEHYFQKDDAQYRVRQELRERVVFASQNLLQDPPFSRLDIVTCRNLLIYLEPEVQTRILALLHFGLREGGTLFLGTSETAIGVENIFEPIDKKARIYRRTGPSRHEKFDFPLPHAPGGAKWRERPNAEARGGTEPRPSMAQMSSRTLLEHHTPAAVTIDRDHRIVYYQGDTSPFISTPRGEPTRDLMDLVRNNMRGAVRTALQRAATEHGVATVLDGWIENTAGRRVRIAVTASPLDLKNAPDYMVLSFHERGEQPDNYPPAGPQSRESAVQSQEAGHEVIRMREELQSTIEELQTTNEELKASHEEVVSVNEELQSSNEELETSREEMQSLNEELSTVNSQLHAKIDEHQAAHNDLSSLLMSTNIAVLFLDTRFRIRRFTPQVRELFEMLESDIGRPLSDLAKKFSDDNLQSDAERVLTSLAPSEREILSGDGRWYLRRLTPYRTADNRIDGVVITFVDVSARLVAEASLRASEERLRVQYARTSEILESISDAFYAVDAEFNFTYVNRKAEELWDRRREDLIGKNCWAEFPELVKTEQYEMHLKVMKERRAVQFETLSTVIHAWVDISIYAEGNGGLSCYFREIQERRLAEDALRASKAAAEEANRMKDEFLATLSHELRTPLGAILLWSKLLQSDGLPDAEQLREGLNAIRTSAESQKALIEDLLDLSRVTRGQLRMQVREVELVPVVRDALDAIEPAASARGVKVSADLAADAGVARVDSDRIRQIVWNLLTNAVKFTPRGGWVKVGLSRSDGQVEIQVADSGIGMSAEFMPRVFERFTQADASHSREAGGMGLGLAIVKQLVELHGGTISARSDGENRGATFVVRLPASNPFLSLHGAGLTATSAAGDPSAMPLEKFNVLVVEDDLDTRRALVTILKRVGAVVAECSDAAEAMEAFERTNPELIISDIGLPGEDGNSLLRRIRLLEIARGKKQTPAIALTAFVFEKDRQMALDAGFQYHIGKPFEPDELLATLQQCLPKS